MVDIILDFFGFYNTNSYFKVPAMTICRVGFGLACAWVLICNEKVKGQLIEKYPRGIGRFLVMLAREVRGGVAAVDVASPEHDCRYANRNDGGAEEQEREHYSSERK